MSKGLGVTQRGLIELFRRRPFAAFTLERLTERLFADSTRAQRVSVMRAVRSLARSGVLPLTWKERRGRYQRGAPLVVWRADNGTACWRAERLTDANDQWGDWGLSEGWPTHGTKPSRSPAPLPPHVLGAIAASAKLLISQGKTPTTKAITELLSGIYSREVVESAWAQLKEQPQKPTVAVKDCGCYYLGR